MTLALLVPRNYRHRPVLIRFHGNVLDNGRAPFDFVDRVVDVELEAALRSFREEGGELLRLHRDDQTPRLGAPRR